MIDLNVSLVQEHVDLGGSQFSESILERWHRVHASRRIVVVFAIRKSMSASFTIIDS